MGMTQEEILEIFRRTGALMEGHFILRSGWHSPKYVQCALALQEMPIVERFGSALAEKVRDWNPETVLSPAMGGLVIGQEVARQLRARFLFAEKEKGRLVLRRGFRLRPGERILIVEDVVTKGGRVKETMQIAREAGAEVVGVAALVDRSDSPLDLGVPFVALLRLEVKAYPPDQVPPELAAIPPVKPGS